MSRSLSAGLAAVAILALTGCDLSIFRPGFRADAAQLAQSGVSTTQALQTLYQTLIAERLDVQKADAFRSSEVTSPCTIAPLPQADSKVFDTQIGELDKRVKLAQALLAVYQTFSSEAAFRSGDARSKAQALGTSLKGLLPIPAGAVSSALPTALGGIADALVTLKQNSQLKDYAPKIADAVNVVSQVFTSDQPALAALAAERREKITMLGNELMRCGLVTLQPVMKDLAADAGLTLLTDESKFAPFRANLVAVAALTPAQHIADTSNAIDADSAALAALIKAHADFAAKKTLSFKDLEQLASKAYTASQKLQAAAAPPAPASTTPATKAN